MLLSQVFTQVQLVLAAAQIENNIREAQRKQQEAEEQNQQNVNRFLRQQQIVEENMKAYYETGPGCWTDCARDGILDISIDDRTQK